MLLRRSQTASPRGGEAAEEVLRAIGNHLRELRLQRGEDLDEVADYLRIKPSYLQALEEGDLGAMPGRPYALGFLRTYADFLGLDGDGAVAEVKAAVEGLPARPELNYRTPLPENRRPKAPLLALSLVLAGLVYAGWYLLHEREGSLLEAVAEVPEQLRGMVLGAWPGGEGAPAEPALHEPLAEPVPDEPPPPATPVARGESALAGDLTTLGDTVPMEPADDPRTATGEPALERSAEAPLAAMAGVERRDEPQDAEALNALRAALSGQRVRMTGEVPSDDHPPAEPAAESAERDAADEPGSAAEMLAALPANGGTRAELRPEDGEAVRVILRANEASWIQVRSDSRDYVRTQTLEPGETFLVPNRPDLALWTGNAGGLEVLVDGEPIPPIGGRGAVVRDISLDPEQLLRRARPAP